jgi:ribosomal protein S2
MTSDYIARYSPYRDLRAPVRPRNVTIEQLLAAGCHIGHNKSSCQPAMKPFIAGLLDKTHIINLDYTLAHLRRACTIIREVTFRHGVILIIGTRKGHKPILVSATERMGGSILFRKWIPGTVTNGNNVLYRGHLKEETSPFRQYAKRDVKEASGNEKLWEGPTMQKWVFNHDSNEWIVSTDDVPVFRDWHGELRKPRAIADPETEESSLTATNSRETSQGRSIAPTALSNSMIQKARQRGDLAEWMAWDKFASIVQSVSDLSAEILLAPQQALPAGLLEYIPDHSDNWYRRQIEEENAEMKRRQALAAATGDRNPLEMHEMDKFLARKGYRGSVRGDYVFERVENLEKEGLQAYPHVKVFRDGSTMIGQRRFDKTGAQLTQYSDGSYLFDRQLYDREGKRYDSEHDALVFSDGSQLRFLGEGEDRKLVVVIDKQVFDVTSTVVGSAEKREILEKAEDLLHESGPGLSTADTRRQEQIERLLGGPPHSVKFGSPLESQNLQSLDTMSANEVLGGEGTALRGSEMLEISDKVDSKILDDLVSDSNRMTDAAEDLQNVEPVQPDPDSPFDNMYSTSPSTIRPDLIILLNPRENRLALREATNNQIPTIGIIDTDSDPRWVTYSIPANDDSLRSVEFIAGVLTRAGEEGLIHRRHYSQQLQMLQDRAKAVLKESQLDYHAISDDDISTQYEKDDRTVGSVISKYCEWYGLDKTTTSLGIIAKIVANHVVMAQDEIKRLNADTTGWSMQNFLDQIKTSTRFPGIPDLRLEEMAKIRMRKSREAYYEEKEKPIQRRALEQERTVEDRIS